MRRAMEKDGYRVAVASNGEQCLSACQQIQPDMVLLDGIMPVMDGFASCAALRELLGELCPPVLMITALDDRESVDKAFAVGATDYVTKPIHWAVLRQRVRRILAERWAWTELLRQVERKEQLAEQLEQKAAALEETLYQLKQTQAQLVQTEKMSSLGQLVAGVAHEINNPVTFISGNLEHTGRYAIELLDLVRLYRQHYLQPMPEIQAKLDELDLDFIAEDMPKMLESMTVGVGRIQKIVLCLRSFSRLDESEMKPANIHEGIDSTLLLLEHRLKERPSGLAIKVLKEYGNLPLVECYPSQLNQVFMNIFNNAIDALEEKMAQQEDFAPMIRIVTESENAKQISIRIADNGPGMTDAVQKRLFDPFFTTKTVGKGTGLGMAISYQIVTNRHGGGLKCISQPGLGTELSIAIPIR
ncbi:MAG: response regulator [Oscillatoria sp. SIO1A7]|nr:response regulator [Oscillatoria sp. SIO1A7]